MRRGRYNLNDYDDDDDFPWYAKGLLVALLCGAVWLLVTQFANAPAWQA